eukprot:TRINITY_DN4051_c0_g1_i2.p1 TRINITY_DN4051_c0_g1~~TRINITY_DN4051_c0_g1_i2.p1  ORF type:complete len:489 (-),score=140.36 TRINITY_DN4051_c0_g1_i2:26-1492(-)
MRLINKNLEKDGSGHVGLIPEEQEDMWHAYNLIFVGDHITATTVRRVNRNTAVSSSSERLRLTLTIHVEKIVFEADSGLLRVSGPNRSENPHVKMGAYHSIDLEMNRKFTLTKAYWDSITLQRITDACDPTKSADLAAVVMSEGLAYICLITKSMTLVRGKIELTIPRKRKGSSALHDKALDRFFDMIMQGILRHVDFNVVKCIIIASPGFTKDQFFEYMNNVALSKDIKSIKDNKGKFILAHSSSGEKHALNEVLADPSLVDRLSETKAAGEVDALNRFYAMLRTEPDRAFYGLADVMQAQEKLAIQDLLLTDELFRSADIAKRRKYIELTESVKSSGGNALIFSTLHVSGERTFSLQHTHITHTTQHTPHTYIHTQHTTTELKQLGGIAAILRFPLPEIDEERASESDTESDTVDNDDDDDNVDNADEEPESESESEEEKEQQQQQRNNNNNKRGKGGGGRGKGRGGAGRKRGDSDSEEREEEFYL